MDDFKIDARRWRFLNNPASYIETERASWSEDERKSGGLQLEPLSRQFKTAKAILERIASGRGVLLADDVGLGKTTVAALVAWVVACQNKRVRIYAPNEVLRRIWAEELERHVPMLKQFGASGDRIKPGNVKKLAAGRIQVATHDALVKSHGKKHLACDLMIIDEAHRARGEQSKFTVALQSLGGDAKRKLILTATPFSIRLAELERLLEFVGATELEAVRDYAVELSRLYSLGDGHDVTAEVERLVKTAKRAIDKLQPHLIRHGIDDLLVAEQKHFGTIAKGPWDIQTPPASQKDLALLLRMDRLLQLTPEQKGKRRNDPRFHIGWQHVDTELARARERATDDVAGRHIAEASKALSVLRRKPHPKIDSVSDAIRTIVDKGEKVLVFCHHRATASELLSALERALKATIGSRSGPPEKVWRQAWKSLLAGQDDLVAPIIDWLCTPGLRAQIGGWLDQPALTVEELKKQFATVRPRNAELRVPTILESAKAITTVMLDQQSKSTRSLLQNIRRGSQSFGGKTSHFPGRLDDGFRVMGAWHHDGLGDPPKTLYTGQPDVVLALFNSPFGPDVLVTTDWLSEGVDLHRYCRHLIHYELDPSPVRTIQRNGRVRRVGSWAAITGQSIQYAYPTFGGTRDEKAVVVMKQRINAFGLLLGGVPSLDDDDASDSGQRFADAVLRGARKELESLNRKLRV